MITITDNHISYDKPRHLAGFYLFQKVGEVALHPG